MKKCIVFSAGKVLLILFLIFLLRHETLNASELESYRIPFFGGKTAIEFKLEKSSGGDGVGAYLTGIGKTGNVRVDLYEPEEGKTPMIRSVFVSGKKPKMLFVIVAWGADISALDTGGSIY